MVEIDNFNRQVTQQPQWPQKLLPDCIRISAVRNPANHGDIVWLDGGASHVGTNREELPADGEGPVRKSKLKPFGISRFAVTNAEFAEFAAATGYVTEAQNFDWSFVFRGLLEKATSPSAEGLPWWQAVKGAYWAAPFGPGSDWLELPDHPAVHISFHDACAHRVVAPRPPFTIE